MPQRVKALAAKSEEEVGHPGTGITGHCEPSDIGVENQTLVFCKSSNTPNC